MKTLEETRRRLAEVREMIRTLPVGGEMAKRYSTEEQSLITRIAHLSLEEERR